MSTAKIECGMTLERVAESARRVFTYAHADGAPAADLLGFGPVAWLGLARAIEPVLVKFEGASWPEVAVEVFACWSELFGPAGCGYGWEVTTPWERLAWEAVARHLTWLFDLDEPLDSDDLARSEARYIAWASTRFAALHAQPQRSPA